MSICPTCRQITNHCNDCNRIVKKAKILNKYCTFGRYKIKVWVLNDKRKKRICLLCLRDALVKEFGIDKYPLHPEDK